MIIKRLLDGSLIPALAILAIAVCLSTPAAAQDQMTGIQQQAPSVFLDCNTNCYADYIRTNIDFVDYVRDQNDADIHLQINQTSAGSGSQYTLTFIGRQNFTSQTDTLTYSSPQSDTQDERRAGLARTIRIGLYPYLAQTPVGQYIDLIFNGPSPSEQSQQVQQQVDPWNSWIFEIDLNGSLDGEESENSYEIRGGLSAERVTEDWKIELSTDYNYEEENFELRSGEKVSSTTINKSFDGLAVKSLGPHWSAGISTQLGSSTFQNLDFQFSASPTIEYNLFPYREYNQHELLFRYRISPTYYEYAETTINLKDDEFVVQQQLRIELDVTQTWGNINASLTAQNYLRDFSQNRLNFGGFMNFRIFRGLSLRVNGNYSLINDQITLPAGDISDAEALLRQRQRATGYNYRIGVGISYTFGSIFNSAVNPRFGGGGGGGGFR